MTALQMIFFQKRAGWCILMEQLPCHGAGHLLVPRTTMEMYAASYRGISVTAAGGTLHGSNLSGAMAMHFSTPFASFPGPLMFHESSR